MGKKKAGRLRKISLTLFVLCFVFSALIISVSASDNSRNKGNDGYNTGYEEGKKKGQEVCKQYGLKETLIKIPSQKSNLVKDSVDYKSNYEKGFTDGYRQYRYNCLKAKNKK